VRFPILTQARQPFRPMLFGEREFHVFVWEDGADFDVPAKRTHVVPQCPKFHFGTLFEPGDFALLYLHGERKFSLGNLAVLAQFIERHAFKNGVGALFGAGAASRSHQLVGDAVVRESLVCHSVLSRLRSLLQGSQVFAVEFIGFANQLLVKATLPMLVTTDEQDGGTFGIESKECAKRQMLVMRGAQFLHVGKCRSLDGIDIRPSEHWDRAIERAVKGCRGLVVILSPRSVASDNVADEISYAIDSGKSVLPVKIEACNLPLRLTRKQVVDATGSYDRALQQCLDALMGGDKAADVLAPAPPARTPLDPESLHTIKQQLAPILGPIAARLVDKEAVRAGSIPELYDLLSEHIDPGAERERFIALAPKGGGATPRRTSETPPAERPQAAIPAAELETLARLMARYVGPIASVMVKRESRTAGSMKALRHQLAETIADQGERAEFLRLSGG